MCVGQFLRPPKNGNKNSVGADITIGVGTNARPGADVRADVWRRKGRRKACPYRYYIVSNKIFHSPFPYYFSNFAPQI